MTAKARALSALVASIAAIVLGCAADDGAGPGDPALPPGDGRGGTGVSGSAGSGVEQPQAGDRGASPVATDGGERPLHEPPGRGPSAMDPPTGAEPVPLGAIVPLFDASTVLEPELLVDRGDAVVTRFGDRGRDRHAREDEFQSYDHYLPHYWEHRTARFAFADYVGKGGSTIDVAFVTEWKLGPAEFRAWYLGKGTVAHYSGNYAPRFQVEGPGTYDDELEKISSDGVQYKYTYTIDSAILLDGSSAPLAVGQFMEIEVSQFLDSPPRGRENYYGTTLLYEVGKGGLVPWHAIGTFEDQSSERENSHKLDEKGWLGGRTTLPYQYSDEPDNHFMQMAINIAAATPNRSCAGGACITPTCMMAATTRAPRTVPSPS
jgi:hypothetical protein